MIESHRARYASSISVAVDQPFVVKYASRFALATSASNSECPASRSMCARVYSNTASKSSRKSSIRALPIALILLARASLNSSSSAFRAIARM